MSQSQRWREEDRIIISKIADILRHSPDERSVKIELASLIRSIVRDREKTLERTKASGRGHGYHLDARLIPAQLRPNPVFIDFSTFQDYIHS